MEFMSSHWPFVSLSHQMLQFSGLEIRRSHTSVFLDGVSHPLLFHLCQLKIDAQKFTVAGELVA